MGRRGLVFGFVVAMLAVRCGWGQEGDPAGEKPGPNVPTLQNEAEPTVTLHVYANLMQIPVLVLSSDHERMKDVPEAKFRISLDSGPKFEPTHVRREGDDPIEMAVLVDASNPQNDLLPRMSEALAGLGAGSLREGDHVSIYALDCALTRSVYDVPAEGPRMRRAVDVALERWRERRARNTSGDCKNALGLWDAMSFVIQETNRAQWARRVVVAVTDGRDSGSHTSWRQVMKLAQRTSTAVFGVLSETDLVKQRGEDWDNRGHALEERMRVGVEKSMRMAEDPFDMICQSSGGVEMPATARHVDRTMARLTAMVRERYIVEYPRSDNATGGEHSIEVTIGGNGLAYVRSAGITVPLADRKTLANPLTIPGDPGKSPVEGSRKVLSPD